MSLVLQDVLRVVVENMETATERLPSTLLVPGRYTVFVHDADYGALATPSFTQEVERTLSRALQARNRKQRSWFGFGPVLNGRVPVGRDRPTWEIALRKAGAAARHVARGDVRVESVMKIAREEGDRLTLREKTVVTLRADGRLSSDTQVRELPPERIDSSAWAKTATDPPAGPSIVSPSDASAEDAPAFTPVDPKTARQAVLRLRETIRQALAEAGVPIDSPDSDDADA